MTALAAAPTPAIRAVPWSRLGWVVWRRYRTMLMATIGCLALIGVYLIVNGERMRAAYHATTSCRPVNAPSCAYAFQTFHDRYAQTGLIGAVLLFLPGIVGTFVGAPLLARELETGTFRYAWTQGAGRMRWAVALVVSGGLGVAVIMTAFGALITWHNQPLLDTGDVPRLHTTSFPETGTAAAGWALAGFALGVLAGLLWRRVVPAIVTAFAAWFGLAYLAATFLRQHYLAPLTTTSLDLPLKDVRISQWWSKGGVRVSTDHINTVLSAIGSQFSSDGGKVTVGVPGADVDPTQYLLQHGYTQITSYQPDGRYWTFQWIETGWLAALALLLLGAAFWLLRRRPA
ncbi:MAG: hypothetical protein JWP74_268 [Marmoricola sp.]|nr:hypothetical protein [Marmoricola sp.]